MNDKFIFIWYIHTARILNTEQSVLHVKEMRIPKTVYYYTKNYQFAKVYFVIQKLIISIENDNCIKRVNC